VGRAIRESRWKLARDRPDLARPPESLDASCGDWWRSVASYYADPSRARAEDLPGTCHDDVREMTWRAAGDYDVTFGATRPEMPILVVYGRQDPISVCAVDVVNALPRGSTEVVWLEDCGHRPMFECPGPFFAALEGFLDARP
jgi:pimeloyl-ACP methyl ester carboxylesterase